jgi:hypothetical protein
VNSPFAAESFPDTFRETPVSASTVDFQEQPVHEVAVENADDAAAIEALPTARKSEA